MKVFFKLVPSLHQSKNQSKKKTPKPKMISGFVVVLEIK